MSLLFDMDEIQKIHDANIESEARKDEREKANEKGIRALVETCKEFGASVADTISRVVENYDMGEQEAGNLVRKYWQSM